MIINISINKFTEVTKKYEQSINAIPHTKNSSPVSTINIWNYLKKHCFFNCWKKKNCIIIVSKYVQWHVQKCQVMTRYCSPSIMNTFSEVFRQNRLLTLSKFISIKDYKHHVWKFRFALRKLYFHFLSNWMGYDRGDSFSFDFEPNGSKSNGKLSPRAYPIQCESKWKYSFLSV